MGRPQGALTLTFACPQSTGPDRCDVALGDGHLVTSGRGADHFFRATGWLGQVTVVDTRDGDPGWTVTGRASGRVGWRPLLVRESPGFVDSSGSAYAMRAHAGSAVAASTSPTTGGLSSGGTLGWAPPSSGPGQQRIGGLGVAVFDAEVEMLATTHTKASVDPGLITITAI